MSWMERTRPRLAMVQPGHDAQGGCEGGNRDEAEVGAAFVEVACAL